MHHGRFACQINGQSRCFISHMGPLLFPDVIFSKKRRRLWQDTAAVFSQSHFMQARLSWQPAAATTPQKCGACHRTARQRLVWRRWRGTAAGFPLSPFMQARPFWQPAALTAPQKCGACHRTARQRLVLLLWRGTAVGCGLSPFMQARPSWQPAAGTGPQNCGSSGSVRFDRSIRPA